MKTAKTAALAGLLGAFLVAGSSTALAQARYPETGFYAGGALGQSKDRELCDGLPSGLDCDDSDVAFKIFGGYQVNPNLAVEAAYTDLGETKLSDPFDSATFRAKAWEVVAVGMYPFPEGFTLYGKLGLYRAQTKAATTSGISEKESNNDVTFGFGGRYDFNRNLAVRVEWQRYPDVGGETIGETDNDVFSVGVIWKF